MKPFCFFVIVGMLFVSACSGLQSAAPTASSTSTPRPSPTRPTRTASATRRATGTFRPPTPTEGFSLNLGVTPAELEAAFAAEGFAFSPPAVVNGQEVVKGTAPGDYQLEMRSVDGFLMYAKLNIPNKGPQTNRSLLSLFLETLIRDPEFLDFAQYWLVNDALDYADQSPFREASITTGYLEFYTYANDPDYTTISLWAYVSLAGEMEPTREP
jgi:hypothetical protein